MDETLGGFLGAHRAALTPTAAGLATTGRRRVPGLRRDEVAVRAGVSTDYYTRLEQGRVARPSPAVLRSLARALQLTDAQRAHLHNLAAAAQRPGARRHPPTTHVTPQPARPALQAVLDAMPHSPALIMDESTQVIAWNNAANIVIADFDATPQNGRNLARLLFLDPLAAARHEDWPTAAREVTGILRMAVGRDPDNAHLASLIDELAQRSDRFRDYWRGRHVHQKTNGPKQFRHPDIGRIDLSYETFHLADAPNLALVVFAAPAGSSAHDALALLVSHHHPATTSPTRSAQP